MLRKHPLIFGTFILTLTGLLSRVIGFFYRIFLSNIIGEEGMGIYQLLAPIMVLSFSITAAGIQTAISKYVASEPTTHDYKASVHFLLAGFTISILLSLFTSFILFQNADYFAKYILLEARCEPLVRIFSLSIPFAAVHCCINGYYYGIKNASIPAITQLSEQLFRVGSVFLIYKYFVEHHLPVQISISVIGLTLGEISSCFIGIFAFIYRFQKLQIPLVIDSTKKMFDSGRKLLYMAFPLSLNRIVLNLLQSIEAIYIPNKLMLYGLSNDRCLSVYGVLTGMAMPLILFPNALTGSISVMLLPYVAQAQAEENKKQVSASIKKCVRFGLLLGFACTLFFFLLGNFLGNFLFQSEMAGSFIKSMSFICPFLYLATILSSIMHGLGKAGMTFVYNTICLLIRLFFVFFFIPVYGIHGYLWGLLVSELLLCALYLFSLRKFL